MEDTTKVKKKSGIWSKIKWPILIIGGGFIAIDFLGGATEDAVTNCFSKHIQEQAIELLQENNALIISKMHEVDLASEENGLQSCNATIETNEGSMRVNYTFSEDRMVVKF